MAAFTNDSEGWGRLDYSILQNGWANLYLKSDIVNEHIAWLAANDYEIIKIDCAAYTDNNAVVMALGRALRFPEHFNGRLDAFNDSLCEVKITGEGIAIILLNFQVLYQELAHALLDIIADNARVHLLFGNKILTLVQVNDPQYSIGSIGSTQVMWNNLEQNNLGR